jgi:hypothetical protein
MRRAMALAALVCFVAVLAVGLLAGCSKKAKAVAGTEEGAAASQAKRDQVAKLKMGGGGAGQRKQ